MNVGFIAPNGWSFRHRDSFKKIKEVIVDEGHAFICPYESTEAPVDGVERLSKTDMVIAVTDGEAPEVLFVMGCVSVGCVHIVAYSELGKKVPAVVSRSVAYQAQSITKLVDAIRVAGMQKGNCAP